MYFSCANWRLHPSDSWDVLCFAMKFTRSLPFPLQGIQERLVLMFLLRSLWKIRNGRVEKVTTPTPPIFNLFKDTDHFVKTRNNQYIQIEDSFWNLASNQFRLTNNQPCFPLSLLTLCSVPGLHVTKPTRQLNACYSGTRKLLQARPLHNFSGNH